MSDLKLGVLLDGSEQRDAAHVAVAPVIAAENLRPGDRIGFIGPDTTEEVSTHAKELIGVVDPFLKNMVATGERFWMLMYPQTVTVLRHAWAHPAFPDPVQTCVSCGDEVKRVVNRLSNQESIDWLKQFAKETGYTYEDVLERGEKAISTGEATFYCNDYYDWKISPNPKEFWRHFQAVTGKAPINPTMAVVEFCC